MLAALSLAAVPLVLLGTFGLVGAPVDFISSPAANVASGRDDTCRGIRGC